MSMSCDSLDILAAPCMLVRIWPSDCVTQRCRLRTDCSGLGGIGSGIERGIALGGSEDEDESFVDSSTNPTGSGTGSDTELIVYATVLLAKTLSRSCRNESLAASSRERDCSRRNKACSRTVSTCCSLDSASSRKSTDCSSPTNAFSRITTDCSRPNNARSAQSTACSLEANSPSFFWVSLIRSCRSESFVASSPSLFWISLMRLEHEWLSLNSLTYALVHMSVNNLILWLVQS